MLISSRDVGVIGVQEVAGSLTCGPKGQGQFLMASLGWVEVVTSPHPLAIPRPLFDRRVPLAHVPTDSDPILQFLDLDIMNEPLHLFFIAWDGLLGRPVHA